ncbi:putative lipid II flippase FtsW [Govanella unica]|uniref:Probable peptidoglycan glycosyltransferase FtsW n=1 Tax=Govanella unica TaxID=2975056 RepID=A0A9X3Z8B7_9PROT|nr:putative lipid II flippase FtsW [Govania unica]MDA5195077.1 putative lipid II flippase FtsW [Govania unica]
MFTRTDRSLLGNWWWTVDRGLLLALTILIGFGMLLTYGASVAVAERLGLSSFHFAERQLGYLLLTVLLMFGISLASPRTVRRTAVALFPVVLGLVVLAGFFGPEIKGSRRWLPLGSFALQPSEFLKPLFIVTCAWMFSEQMRNPQFPGRKIAAVILLMTVTALVMQPDIGQTALIVIVWLGLFFLAGLPLLWLVVLGITGVVAMGAAYMFLPHVTSRINRFLDPASGDTYQIDTALNAFRNGGLFGRGPGEGLVKRVLPDAHTDFIFAVAGEEFGVVACLGLLLIFAIIVIRGLLNLLKENDPFVYLATAGLLFQFGVQAYINMGVNLAVLPSKGMTLPFVSYGGSSMLALGLTMGMVLSFSRRQPVIGANRPMPRTMPARRREEGEP